jgi:peptide/nickel transport system substrate-binding protein
MRTSRRQFGLIACTAALGRPSAGRAAAPRTIRFVPQTDIRVLDPIWSPAFVVRNFGYLVYDTLFALDARLRVKPQMVDRWEVSDDRVTYTFTLRDGLRFHDGAPVTSADCIASLRRWSRRDPLGQKLAEQIATYAEDGDSGFRIALKAPFPLLLDAIGKVSSNTPFIMPKRLADTDPFHEVKEVIGSGPFRFVAGEWVPGAKAVFTRNESYVPRREPPSFAAGGKRVMVDRVEWLTIPDQATAANALAAGEVDWVEQPLPDLLPDLARNPGVTVAANDPYGNIGALRFNQLLPPFNDERARRAVLLALDQDSYRQAMGGDPRYSRTCFSYFTCGTPMATTDGPNPLRDGPNPEAARALLKEAGVFGSRVVVLDAVDLAPVHAQGMLTAELLKSLGFQVDLLSFDWGTVISRRNSRAPLDKGGWSVTHSYSFGLDAASPATNIQLRSNGAGALYGWPDFPTIERLRDTWFQAEGAAAQSGIAAELQQEAFRRVPYIPTGQFFTPTAYRKTLSNAIEGPIPFFWGVEKAD